MIKRERLIEILEYYNGTSGDVNPIADLILDEIENSPSRSIDKAGDEHSH